MVIGLIDSILKWIYGAKCFNLNVHENANSRLFFDAIGYLRVISLITVQGCETCSRSCSRNELIRKISKRFCEIKKMSKSTFDWQTVLYAFKSKSSLNHWLPDYCFSYLSDIYILG